MSPTLRVRLIVVAAALAAAGVVAGVVYATRQDPAQPRVLCRPAGATIVKGVASPDAAAVAAAMREPARAAARTLEPLAQAHPNDPVVVFNEARALYCGGFVAEAEQAFQQAKKAGRNTYYEVVSDNFLHPQFFDQGYPPLVYTGKDPLIVQGQKAQQQFHQHTAEKLWAEAARREPGSDVAQVAAAVGRFDMDDLSASFSRLGPLVKRFPRSQSVRFHLGLLLTWTGQGKQALVEFRKAVALGPKTTLGRDAGAFVRKLVTGGTNRAVR